MNDIIPEVQYLAPPTVEMEETILRHIQPYTDSIPEGKHAVVAGVITEDNLGRKIMNGVIAVKVKDRLEIGGYIGKTWGDKNIVWGTQIKFFI